MSVMDEESAKAVAARYLSYRARSRAEVVNRLEEEGFDEDVISSVVESFTRYGYIDDEKFCEAFAHDKRVINGFGNERIRNELLEKGVDAEVIDKCLVSDDFNEEEEALRLIRKRFGKATSRWELISKYKEDPFNRNDKAFINEKRKAIDFLIRKGYSYGTAEEALKAFLNE